MLLNYIKISFRNLVRNKAYTAINVLGLALGMSCGILIFTLVTHHLSFDNFHPNRDRIYRFVTEQKRETTSYASSVPSPLGKAFRNDYTFGENVARIFTATDILITVKDGRDLRKFKEEEGVAFAESAFFDLFNFPFLAGDPGTALTEPNTAILTERMARKYFGTANPINKTLRVDNKIDLRITGVLKDLPANTDRQTEIFISYVTLKQFNEWLASDDAWGGMTSGMQCFVRLRPGVSPEQVERVLPAYVEKYRPNSKNVHHYHLQALADIHFNAQYGGVMTKTNLWVLALIGLFLIITACVNFINLATAQAINRAKEVGVRKALGSLRGQLFWQFIAETGLITVVAMLLAVLGSQLALPFVNDWFQSGMRIDFLANWQLTAFTGLLVVVVTFFSGSYPGLILARFQPVVALKGKLSQQSIGGFNTRRTLIVTQFAISQMLIIGVIIIASQMRFAQQSDLGFDKEAVVMVPIASESKLQTQHTIQNRFSRLAGVKRVALCQAAPASDNNWNTSPRYDNRSEDESFSINVRAADDQYTSLFGLQLVAGRNIYPADTVREFLVNETFAKKLNLNKAQEVIGKVISLNGDRLKGPIVGVVRDFHNLSFHEDISAVCIASATEQYSYYAVKINLANARTTLAGLEKVWTETHPDQIFEYQFLDEQIAEFYETEALMLKLIQAFAAIALFIGCLGLYGLVSFMAAQKTKEIGIRKVLGSSTGQIVWIFVNEFSRLILIAFVVAAPIAWYAMNAWLKNFEYKIDLGIGVFALAILGTFVVAMLTIGYRAVSAALMNPINALRTE
ncbi:ABC transporter permease [Spirosoma utsteinense]|uniref:Permease n=1 Tax=Spirosoma utsteinense TaxID=2585773 RepID=A0ABR6W5G4_9BACT|nr:ABC transporter permease [Spirosoma utsteinense]MBC3791814.1 putative permease [Spirosoma utsteinense]